MIRRSLAVKIGLAIMGLILAVSVVQYIALSQLLKNAFYGQSGSELITEGQQYANMSSMGGTMMMNMLCMTSGASVVMIGKNGAVISASPTLHLSKPNGPDSAIIQAALNGHNELHGGFSAYFGNAGMMAGVPIKNGKQITGAVLLFRPDGIVGAAFRQVTWLLFLVGAGGILIALGLTVILSKRLANPLQQMASVAKEMSQGNYTAKVPVISDDEVGKLGTAINELAANLHYLDASRKEFLADVSHELRTPMSYIRGYSQVLEEGLITSPEEVKEYLRIINEESKRLEGLVDDLFTLAQADARILQIEKHPIQLTNVIQSVINRVRMKAEDKQIEIRTNLSSVPVIQADSVRLEQVLVNLLDNAIRYTKPHGYIEVGQEKQGDYVVITVSDTGTGIPENDLPHIWDRLYRVEKSRSRAGGGTGLGLAIVKQIIEAHGGSVHAQSTEQVGTTISFRIPIH